MEQHAVPAAATDRTPTGPEAAPPPPFPWLAPLVDGFDPTVPLARASLPPKAWYRDPDFYLLEQATVFKDNWCLAARADQLRHAGDYVTGVLAGEPYVIVRDSDGTLRAHYNVCRHHAAIVAQGEQGSLIDERGNVKDFECPYHGWRYAPCGRLTAAPGLGAVEGFDRAANSLVPIDVQQAGPFVFVCMARPGRQPRPLSADFGPLLRLLEERHVGDLTFAARRVDVLAGNWKVYVDNYLDGGYHVNVAHKGLAGQLDLTTYRTEVFDRYSVQSSAGVSRPGARVGAGALYGWLYPNAMFNVYGEGDAIMDVNLVVPLGPDRYQVIMDFYFKDTTGPEAEAFIQRCLAESGVVQDEDVWLCDQVTAGLSSRSYERGRYASPREQGQHHFHKLLHRDYLRGVEGE